MPGRRLTKIRILIHAVLNAISYIYVINESQFSFMSFSQLKKWSISTIPGEVAKYDSISESTAKGSYSLFKVFYFKRHYVKAIQIVLDL